MDKKRLQIKNILKEIISESNYFKSQLISEVSIETLKSQFVDTNKVSKKDFKQILDVTNQKSAYATWLIKRLISKDIESEDIVKFKKYLSIFDRRKKDYEHQDINQYKDKSSIEDFIRTSQDIESKEKSNPSVIKGLSKYEKYNPLKIGEVDGFHVYKIPKGKTKLHQAACDLGTDTDWCTAHSGADDTFGDYIRMGPLYIFINPTTDEKYQFHYETKQFMNKYDRPIAR